MFLPSGRVHALGAGSLIFEIQQNSDTTYRVFDWNRLGLDGKPRELHIPQALAAIDFDDFEPALAPSEWKQAGPGEWRRLADCPLFSVDLIRLCTSDEILLGGNKASVLAVTEGQLAVSFSHSTMNLMPGEFCVVPASCTGTTLLTTGETVFLKAVAN